MTKPNDGGPAFPNTAEVGGGRVANGMSLRDYFAAKAMQGLIGKLGHVENLARDAYFYADLMLKERNRAEIPHSDLNQ